MRRLFSVFLGLIVLAVPVTARPAPLSFPPLKDGRVVLSFDPHMHTVFSDGQVWPQFRVEEARREQIAAIAITDHLEYQPKRRDLPNPDRNRPYAIAQAHARGVPIVINGFELTRGMPPGHFNILFVEDVNAYRIPGYDAFAASAALYKKSRGEFDTLIASLERARDEDAFVIWNHPDAPSLKDRKPVVLPIHDRILKNGLVQGIEVAMREKFVREAIGIALTYDLTIMASSDSHRPAVWENDQHGLRHRTVTLVLAEDAGKDALKAALRAKATVAFYDGMFIGRAPQLTSLMETLVEATLVPPDARIRMDRRLPHTAKVRIANRAPVSLTFEAPAGLSFVDEGPIFSIAPGTARTLRLKGREFTGGGTMALRILNTLTDPATPLTLDIAF